MENTNELELLKHEISELKKENQLLKIKSEVNDFINESYSNSMNMGVWLEISFKETNDYGLVFHIESSNDLIELMSDEIEIGYIEINNWFYENNKPYTHSNLIECIDELIELNF